MMGTFVTEGNHIYITHPKWKLALMELLDVVWEDQDTLACNSVFLRDFDASDTEFKYFFMTKDL